MAIPLSRSVLGAEEALALQHVLDSGRLVQGPQVEKLEHAVAARVGRKHAIAVANGTVALTLALEALEIEAGAAVLVPDLTWPSPAHAVLGIGGRPVLVDVDAHSWNVSPETASHALGEKNLRAAIVIDQFGCPADVHAISALFPALPIISDAACALGSIAPDKQACGARGIIACLSFHPRKLVTTGEGGMCLTDDARLAERLRILRNHGQHAPGQFTRASGNARMSELAAAVGCSQLQRLDDMLVAREKLALRYQAELSMLRPQRIPASARANYQTFGVVLPPDKPRDAVISALRQRDIEAGRLSYALHTLPQLAEAAASSRKLGNFDNSALLAERGLALPLYPGLTDSEQSHVIASLKAVLAL